MFAPAPFLLKEASVRQVMLQVCLALLPAIVAYTCLITPAILIQLALATLTALLCEAILLRVQGRPVAPFLGDGSVIVTAWLIALAFPPLAPWWLVVVGTAFGVIVGKHLYGGLGQNPFNPAMVAFAACIVSFPALMSQWPPADLQLPFAQQWALLFSGARPLDALSGATPLDALKTGLRLAEGEANVASILADGKVFGLLGGRHWEWISAAYLVGGLWLWQRRIISWHVPFTFLGSLALLATLLWLFDPQAYAHPLFHVFSGGTLLGAFFIATDPVSGCTTPRGKLIFAGLAGVLTYVIRVFGGYPDGVAFAILLMNLSAPLIDLLTPPPIFGMKDKR